MVSLFYPSAATLDAFIEQQSPLPFTYPMVGETRRSLAPVGFDHDFNTIDLGSGDAVWQAACTALRAWRMFPKPWTMITPTQAPLRMGTVVAMSAQVFGIWWINSCRIVYVIDEPNRFGFAYGTLPGHVEKGEELFLVERGEDGAVWYSLRAFSKPRQFLLRLTYPLSRVFQRKFVRDSKKSMLEAVQNAG
jgi:uncharacterized protein (UPF0548 family)